MLDLISMLLACWRVHPVRTLEQPMHYTAPLGYWSW